MSELVVLSSENHKNYKIVEHADIHFAQQQHLLNVRVNELGQAVTSFPVFLMKDNQSGVWRLSAIASFEVGRSLFVKDNQWLATYKPSSMQSFPFFLMRSPDDGKSYTVGIDEKSSAFSQDEGEAIFETSGKAGVRLSQATKALQTAVQYDINTYQFGHDLYQLGLIKPINIILQRDGGKNETLQGLCTIDEDKFNSLSTEQLTMLKDKGYLMPIHALLLSIYQLNTLVRRNNDDSSFSAIAQVKLEVNNGSFAS